MTRGAPDAADITALLETLDRTFGRNEAAWVERAELLMLRRFRRAILEALEVLEALGEDQRERERHPSSAARVRRFENALDAARSLCAEAVVAARLLDAGCTVEREVETPAGKHVDFRARRDGVVLDIHVKRAPQETFGSTRSALPVAWRALESVARGVVVALHVRKNLRGKALQEALGDAFRFVEQASVGEEMSWSERSAKVTPPAVRLRIAGPSATGHVELAADIEESVDRFVPRFQSTLRKAFSQFMPRSENLIVVCGNHVGFEAFANALLGSQIERWDRRPRPGEFVAYGRGGDGFWAGSMRNQSRLAVYWPLDTGASPLLLVRQQPGTRGPRAEGAAALARSIFA